MKKYFVFSCLLACVRVPLFAKIVDTTTYIKHNINNTDSLNLGRITLELNRAEKIIDHQGGIISGFGTLYTALSVVIALITIGIPVLTYFLTIRPSQQILKNVEQSIDKRVEVYFSKIALDNLGKAVEFVISQPVTIQNYSERTNNMNYITFQHNNQLSEIQILKLLQAAKKSSETGIKYQIFDLISKYKYDIIKDFAFEELRSGETSYMSYFIRYLNSLNDETATKKILNSIYSRDDAATALMTYFFESLNASISETVDLINSDIFDDITITPTQAEFQTFCGVFAQKGKENEFINSRVGKILNSRVIS